MRVVWGKPNVCLSKGNKLRVGRLGLRLTYPDFNIPTFFLSSPHSSLSLPWMAACAGIPGWAKRPSPHLFPPLASEVVMWSCNLGYSSLRGPMQNSVSKVDFLGDSFSLSSLASSAFLSLPSTLGPSLHETPTLRPQDDLFSLQTFLSLA